MARVDPGARPVASRVMADFVGFAVQVAFGAFSFLLVYGAALLVAAGVEALNVWLGAPVWLRGVSGLIEGGIFAADVIGLALLLISEIAKLVRKLWREWSGPDHD